VNVTVNPLPTVTATASPTSICNGETSVLTASGASTYSWSHSLGTGGSKTVTPSATTTYTVTGTSAAGCIGTTTVNVMVNPLPTVSLESSQSSICIGSSTTLTAESDVPGTSFVWSNNLSGNNITVTPTSNTTYTVTGVTADGCTGTAFVTIEVTQAPIINYTTVQSHCGQANGSIVTNVNGGVPPYTYQWSNGANSGNLNNVSAGNYNLTVTDANGCSTTINATITDAPKPQANFIAKPQITTIEDPIIYFENLSNDATIYYWDFGDGYYSIDESTSHMYNSPNTYQVILYAQDQYGCTDTASVEIIIRDIYTFYLPNAFTPNENDLNEQYTIIGNNIDPSNFEMRIFDRWGKEIFYTTDINQGWDGNFKGKPSPDGVYVVRVSFKILGTDDIKHIIKEIVVIR
jgi:gliding motility-associated-like protein